MFQRKEVAMNCINCFKPVMPKQRYTKLGYKTCLDCGHQDAVAKTKQYTIAPINKSNYMLITDLQQLKQLNPKRTT
jgi:recombinational DNA repair protein (RecF pathway)